MSGVNEPSHTQVANELFDTYMRFMSDAELRVVLCAMRKTRGWHKFSDAISLSQFEKMTGLSRQGVINGISRAIERGLMIETGTGKRGVKQYTLNIITGQENGLVNEIDQSTKLTSTGQRNRPVLVNEVDTQKKLYKRNYTKEKDSAAIAAGGHFTDEQLPFDGQPVVVEEEKPATPKPLSIQQQLVGAVAAGSWNITDSIPRTLASRIGKVAKALQELDPVPLPDELAEMYDWHALVMSNLNPPQDGAKLQSLVLEWRQSEDYDLWRTRTGAVEKETVPASGDLNSSAEISDPEIRVAFERLLEKTNANDTRFKTTD